MNAELSTLDQLRQQAESPSPQAWFQLGRALAAQQQWAEAHDWLRRAAGADLPEAQVELAQLLLRGAGLPADPVQAAYWLERAEPSGHPVAAYLLAFLAVGGVVVPLDHRINERLQKAVNGGHPQALLAAAVHFGRKPDAADQQRCLQLLQLAAQRGNAAAALLLAERLRRGEGCEANAKAADSLSAQLAQKGFPPLPEVIVAAPVMPGKANTIDLGDTLQSPPATPLSQAPRVWVVDGLLSADECRLLIALSRPVLQPTRAVDLTTGKPWALALETVSDVTFAPSAEDLAMRLIQLRLANAAGADFAHSEPLRVHRQESGTEFLPGVHDYLPPDSPLQGRASAGNRGATVHAFLAAPPAGGALRFPSAGFEVKPRTGMAVIFDNLLADGSPDEASIHTELPVASGEKWVATQWLRRGPFRTF